MVPSTLTWAAASTDFLFAAWMAIPRRSLLEVRATIWGQGFITAVMAKYDRYLHGPCCPRLHHTVLAAPKQATSS